MGIKLFFLVLFSVSFCADAQNIVVYHATGNVAIKEGSIKTAVTKGAQVSKAAVLELKSNSTCMLIGPKGASVQIDKPGSYSYSRILQLLANARNEGVTTKFFAYVYDNLVYKKEKTSLNVTPVVYRAEPLMKTPQQYGLLSTDQIIFTWRPTALKSSVHFQLLTERDSVLVDTVFSGQQLSYSFPLAEMPLKDGHIYKWNAEDQYNRSKVKVYYYFLVLHSADKSSYEKAWKAIHVASLPQEVKLSLKRDLMLKGYRAGE